MSSTTAPKLKEIKALAATAIRGGSIVTTKRIAVIEDMGLSNNSIEDALRDNGVAIVVQPIVGGSVQDQSGNAWLGRFTMMVSVKVNPRENVQSGKANVDIYELIIEVINSVIKEPRHPGV